MARGAGVCFRLRADALPVLQGALHWATRGYLTRSRDVNLEYVGADFHSASAIDPALFEVVIDAQTSGGLLLSVDPDCNAAERLERAGCLAADIGVVEPRGEHAVILE